MSDDIPELVIDPRNEEEIAAQMIDDLPAEFTDRSRANPIVALAESIAAYSAMVTYWINQWPKKLERSKLNLLGITLEPATPATVTLTFTSAGSTVADVTVPAGTIVKTGSGADAVEFATDEVLTVPHSGVSANVGATATETGAATNVAANTLTKLDVPVGGIASVTNATTASGGQDLESIDQAKARATLAVRSQERVITGEDAAYFTARVDGVSRAKAIGAKYYAGNELHSALGAFVVGVLPDGVLSNGALATELEDAIKEDLGSKAIPATLFTPFKVPVRLVMIETVEVVLRAGYDLASVQAAALEEFENYITAFDRIGDDGRSITGTGWEWGEKLYANEVISLIDRVPGVKRVGAITYRASDDFGVSWSSTPLPLTDVAPGDSSEISSDIIDTFGLLHWGGDYTPSNPFQLTVVS